MLDPRQEVAEAARLARRAVHLGRDDAVVLSYAGFILAYVVGDVDDGGAFVDRALALNANLAAAWAFSGWMKICFGEPETGIEHEAMAIRLSPLDPELFEWKAISALAHLCAGRLEEAAARVESSLRDDPNFPPTLRIAAASYALVGRLEERQKIMARLLQLDPSLRLSDLGEVLPPFRRPEDRARFTDGLRKAGLPA
jgi:tetratricopeptide (TPR) repeat protein